MGLCLMHLVSGPLLAKSEVLCLLVPLSGWLCDSVGFLVLLRPLPGWLGSSSPFWTFLVSKPVLFCSERGVTFMGYGHMFKWIGVVHQQEQRLGTITWVHLNCGTLDDPCCKEGVCRGGDPEPLCPLMSHSVSRSVSPVCLSFCPAVCNRRPDFFLAGVAVGRSLVAVGMQRRDGGQGAGQIKVWRCMFCWIVCCLTAFDWVEGKTFILGLKCACIRPF